MITKDNLISGKELSQILLAQLKTKITDFKEIKPQLVIIQVGDNLASNKYIKHKVKACEKIGMLANHMRLPEKITTSELEVVINELNHNNLVHGIIVQLPLPKHLDEQVVNNLISPLKDADGFSPATLGNVMLNNTNIYPATPYGIIKLLEWKKVELIGANVVIIGRSNIVGKPLANMLINRSATVTVCNTKTKNLAKVAKNADILISAAGSANLITKEFVHHDMTVIDVGANFIDGKYCGDVDFDAVQPLVKYITPVPGGVGPMTIACLLQNTVSLFENMYKK